MALQSNLDAGRMQDILMYKQTLLYLPGIKTSGLAAGSRIERMYFPGVTVFFLP